MDYSTKRCGVFNEAVSGLAASEYYVTTEQKNDCEEKIYHNSHTGEVIWVERWTNRIGIGLIIAHYNHLLQYMGFEACGNYDEEVGNLKTTVEENGTAILSNNTVSFYDTDMCRTKKMSEIVACTMDGEVDTRSAPKIKIHVMQILTEYKNGKVMKRTYPMHTETFHYDDDGRMTIVYEASTEYGNVSWKLSCQNNRIVHVSHKWSNNEERMNITDTSITYTQIVNGSERKRFGVDRNYLPMSSVIGESFGKLIINENVNFMAKLSVNGVKFKTVVCGK